MGSKKVLKEQDNKVTDESTENPYLAQPTEDGEGLRSLSKGEGRPPGSSHNKW